MTHGRTQSRLTLLEEGRVSNDPDVELDRLADHFGVSPDELRAEGEAVSAWCLRAGAETTDSCIATIAADAGISVASLRDEMGRWQSWGRSW